MPSPFPGMNPYFEQEDVWQDFHQTFVTGMRQALVEQVGSRYIVKLELHVYIRELSSSERRLLGRADVGVTVPRTTLGSGETSATNPTTNVAEAPVQCFVPVGIDVIEESYIEVRRTENRQLVTTIELLSPANKYAGPDREAYLSKRRQLLLAGNSNFVEIDLLRGGTRMPLENLPECDYYALAARPERRPEVGVWPISLRQNLPQISIPLLADDPDARIDLQQILHSTYDHGGYANYIYDADPEPRLNAADAKWAREILANLQADLA